jgi:hypothetical protein
MRTGYEADTKKIGRRLVFCSHTKDPGQTCSRQGAKPKRKRKDWMLRVFKEQGEENGRN